MNKKKLEIKNRITEKVICWTKKQISLKAFLEIKVKSGADLTGADLRGADLRGADLRGADLTGADLRGADLTGADLRGADLTGAYLMGADLRDADLTGADLTGADLTGAYLTGVKNYTDGWCHSIGVEIIRRNIKEFTDEELSIVFKVSVNFPCWAEIIKSYRDKALQIFKKLSKLGFDEYEKRYKKETGE